MSHDMKDDPAAAARPCCLTIAGSDSGGNAGVQADLRAFHAYGLHGCTAFTALTAQNPRGVASVLAMPADFVAAQLDAVLGVYSVAAAKTGMMSSPDVVEAVAERFAAHGEIAVVVDPVAVATSGARLAGEATLRALEERLLPLAAAVTPNIPEAETLSGIEISRRADILEAAKRIHGTCGAAVLVKGGHLKGEIRKGEDILFDGESFESFTLPWIPNPVSTHGTGCSLSAALAAELALGRSLHDAVRGAKAHVHRAIANSFLVGPDCGVLGFAVSS